MCGTGRVARPFAFCAKAGDVQLSLSRSRFAPQPRLTLYCAQWARGTRTSPATRPTIRSWQIETGGATMGQLATNHRMTSGNESWRILARWLQITGVAFVIALFVAEAALLLYYSANRPDVPRPEQGLTVGLTWTHPARYGTEQDERRSRLLFDLGFYSFGLIAAGEIIRIYKLGDYSGLRNRPRLPWNHRWGP